MIFQCSVKHVQNLLKNMDGRSLARFQKKVFLGYKVSSANRDAVLQIQADALLGKFDILLVFMFDRLGRRDDETPFVVEWFVKNGIEVWCTIESQQKFDDHIDKLMNYIRYWQASGESLKISARTKTRLAQLVKEGNFNSQIPLISTIKINESNSRNGIRLFLFKIKMMLKDKLGWDGLQAKD